MKPLAIKRLLDENLKDDPFITSYDRDNEAYRVADKETKKGITVSLNPLADKFKKDEKKALDEVLHYIREGVNAMSTSIGVKGKENQIFPVIRSTSFPEESSEGVKLLSSEHTAESRVYYAFDLGKTYVLLNEDHLAQEQLTQKEVEEAALFNLRSLKAPMKSDTVAGNTFYFVNTNDGYDASRILNEALLKEMDKKAKGQLTVSIPHQDVLVFGDIQNERGYDVLAQMAFSFYAKGTSPITALPFMYENGELEPIFILAQRKPKE
ncbi:DUF1444 domain-containing protein [Bacillus sp. H-16]|uniref:DUF1444 domain-containing protein n=1 Tax=Alteribacter salitolerans TaxID=2912333 RepID=UPI0019648DCC|nr:DUF1444 domain-containing protein [Alteribacter salitolerans]MBM7096396.1 DUF1444 domain-containing protein [Alteribacter salitolerans]